MKKLFMLLLGAMLVFGMASCTSCNNENGEKNDTVLGDSTEMIDSVAALNVEHVIAMDRQDMFLNYNKDYRWFETCIDLENFLDEDCAGEIAGIANVFQAIENDGADVFVVLYAHAANGASAVDVKHGFWVEDLPMNEDEIKVTFEEAFQKINEVNLPKPHSKHCVLRKQLGPKACNPQYIFGNTHAQIYVDAVTGAVSKDNPAFAGLNLGCPLGEWP